MTKEELVRTMAKALAEICLHAYVVDCCIIRDANSEAEEDEVYLTQPWHELSQALPVSEEALEAIITGGLSRDWDADVAALAEYIAAAVMEAFSNWVRGDRPTQLWPNTSRRP